jgi:hypothetical protein
MFRLSGVMSQYYENVHGVLDLERKYYSIDVEEIDMVRTCSLPYSTSFENPIEKRSLQRLGIIWRTILRWILKN